MSVKELLDAESRVTLAVTPADLREFALAVVEEAVAAWDARDRADTVVFAKDAARELGVSEGTLWRWDNNGYLKPAGYVGRRPYYMRSQLDNLGRGGRP